MNIEGIKTSVGGVITKAGEVLSTGYNWGARQVTWLKDAIFQMDIPNRLLELGKFIVNALMTIFNWSSRNIQLYGGKLLSLGSQGLSWGLVQTNAARVTVAREGNRLINYGSKHLSSMSATTCAFLATNFGIGVTAGGASVIALIAANHFVDDSNPNLKIALNCGAVFASFIAGAALMSTAPLLAKLV